MDNTFNSSMVISYHLYEISIKYYDSITITTLPIRTKDGLLYLK